ncbi:helix-turn-helix domain-containing protein [Halalkalicoccus salilacus]|uniref:helix-turn-helix domain-containing protein n=1 Tax=Halalkalicoccus salilacus TaxID=3117459 RepID=UPI00300F2F65
MRELVFTLDYEAGCNAVADTLADHPDARIRSLSLHATPESLWRVDHVTGEADALTDIEEAFLTSDYYADCLATEECGATQTTQVLDHTDETLVLYSYWKRTPTCTSVPHLALNHLGDGALFETRHEGREYTWRIIHSGSADVRTFLNDLEAAIGDCAEMKINRLRDASPPTPDLRNDDNGLSSEQEAALRTAVERGYYETPREVDAGELADKLDVPRSTLTYRLRRAEAHLAKQHTARKRSPEGASTVL